MTTHELTLDAVKQNKLPQTERQYRASDFLSESEHQELKRTAKMGARKKRPFDNIDAFVAELIARFGWQAYQAWLTGELDHEKALRLIAAERARDKQRLAPLEAIILQSVAGANNGVKGHAPKSLRKAYDILNQEITKAKGIQ